MTSDSVDAPANFANGRYIAKKLLGKGGQKIVYLVHDTLLDRLCALSFVEAEVLGAEEVQRIKHEAQALARMGAQPNVVTVYDMGEQSGRPFIVSEYIEGGDLAAEIARAEGPLSIARAVEIARDVLRALSVVHARGIVHRDVKPNNVWLDAEGKAKLGDFGLALISERSRITAAGNVTGTPAYVSPEQLENRALDGRADLYSLGCVLYEMFAGRPPFAGSMVAVISQHLHASPTPPSRHNPDLSPAIDRFVLDLIAKDPAARPASAQKALQRLDEEIAHAERTTSPRLEMAESPPAPTTASLAPPRKRGRIVAIAIASIAAAGTATIVATSHPRAASDRRLAILATREPTGTVNATIAWALASRLVEEVDRYKEFRPVSPAGVLTARLAVLKSLGAVPDEIAAAELAKQLDADMVASLSASSAGEGEITVAIHVFPVASPGEGASSPREHIRAEELDADGPARIAGKLVAALERQWRISSLTDEAGDAKGRNISFDAYKLYLEGNSYCLGGQYERCELLARRALALDPDNAMIHGILGCALSFEGKDDDAVKEVERAYALRAQLMSRHHQLVVTQDWMYVRAAKAKDQGDEKGTRAIGMKLVDLDDELVQKYDDPWGYLYGAAAHQYLLGDVPKARELYRSARHDAPSLYPAYFEEAKLLHGDGTNEEADREAARILWTYVRCQPKSDLAPVAANDAKKWGLSEPSDIVCP
jgi:tetratricopeptide (TPR) repeat protein